MDTAAKIILADKYGICGGVQLAIQLFNDTLREQGSQPLYILHELVHNRKVTEKMRAAGAIFISAPEELPAGAAVLIGAHGISPAVENALRARASRVIDATCPIVKKIQNTAASLSPEDTLIFYGITGHPEADGILGRSGTESKFIISNTADIQKLPHCKRPVFLSQTTLNHTDADRLCAALQARFPDARRLGSVCNASYERQCAVEKLVHSADSLIVIGSPHSSNANRLCEIGRKAGLPTWLIGEASELPEELCNCEHIGVTAAASTPPEQIEAILAALTQLTAASNS